MPERLSGEAARRLLVSAAKEFELNPSFVTAVLLWESGWYYQAEKPTRMYGILPSSRDYVEGMWALRNQLEAST